MNIKLIFTSAAALAMVAGTPAFAAKGNQNDQASSAASGSEKAGKKNEGKLCRTFDTTESRMGRTRLCLTPAEWRKFDEQQS
jgi:hypothetical protein